MSSQKPYPVSEVFYSLQGEGHLRGFPMVFIRFAGCSIGCPLCDTDYTAKEKLYAEQIAARADELMPKESRDRWVWLTGGEPTDHDLAPVMEALRERGFSIALATAGHKRWIPPVDWLSISPHDPNEWAKNGQKYGSELKIISGLNGYHVNQFLKAVPESSMDFMYKYVQPLAHNGEESQESLAACKEFLKAHPNWALSRQDHLYWNLR